MDLNSQHSSSITYYVWDHVSVSSLTYMFFYIRKVTTMMVSSVKRRVHSYLSSTIGMSNGFWVHSMVKFQTPIVLVTIRFTTSMIMDWMMFTLILIWTVLNHGVSSCMLLDLVVIGLVLHHSSTSSSLKNTNLLGIF